MNNQNNQHGHTKFSQDLLISKCKSILINKLLLFINKKLKEIYSNGIRHGISIKQLMKINRNIIINSRVDFNKNLLTRTLLEIFSEPISEKFSLHFKDHNKILIKSLLNEKDDEKRYYFENLFNLYFLECIEHFINKRTIDELQGLKTFNEIKNDKDELEKLHINLDNEEDKDYLDTVEYYFNHFEEIIDKMSQRNKRIHR